MTFRRLFAAGLAITTCLAACSPKSSDPVLATVGPNKITLSMLVEAYRGITSQKPDVSTPEARRAFLDDLVHKELMEQEAIRRQPELDDGQRRRLHRYAESQLMSLLSETEVNARIKITDADIETVWQRMDREFKARHILTTSEEKARALLAEINGGRSFEDVCREKSVDDQTKVSGGDLGWVRSGQMVESFDLAMQQVPKGQVSPPVRSRFGWHLIKVDDIRSVERPAQAEVKEGIRNYLTQERSLARQEQFQEELRAKARPENQMPALQLLDSKYYFEVPVAMQNDPYATLNLPRDVPSFTADELKMEVVKFADRPALTVQDFNEALSWKPPGVWPSGKGLEEMESVLKLMVRERLFRDRASELGLDKNADYVKKIRKKTSEIRVNSLYYAGILTKIVPTDAQLRDYFDKNRDRFQVLERCIVARVETADSSLAALAARDWRSGKDFTDVESMVKGLDPGAMTVGASAEIPRGQLPAPLEEKIYGGPVGEIIGPIHVNVADSPRETGTPRWVVLKALEVKPERVMTYDEAASYLPDQTRTWLADQELQKVLEEARVHFPVKIDESALNAIDPKVLEEQEAPKQS